MVSQTCIHIRAESRKVVYIIWPHLASDDRYKLKKQMVDIDLCQP